jgi:hypothetical protein
MAALVTARWAKRWPAATAAMHKVTDKTTFATALAHAPERKRSKVWRLKEEKVVKPPQSPTMTKRRRFSEAA